MPTSRRPDVDRASTRVIVVHYGAPERTLELASSLVDLGVSVTVVANDLLARPPSIPMGLEWFVPPRNLGYAEAARVVIAQHAAAIYVLLNNDVEMPATTFWSCIAALDDEQVGVSAPVLVHRDGTLQSGAATLSRWRRAPITLVDPGDACATCDWVTGAAMFIRSEVFRDVELDGSYFLGAEDIDFCVRVRRRGWMIVCCGQSPAVHHGRQTITGPRWTYYTVRNRVWLNRANFGLSAAMLAWLWSALMLPRIIAADIVRRRSMTTTRLAVMGLRDAWRRKPARSDGPLIDEPRPGTVMKW